MKRKVIITATAIVAMGLAQASWAADLGLNFTGPRSDNLNISLNGKSVGTLDISHAHETDFQCHKTKSGTVCTKTGKFEIGANRSFREIARNIGLKNPSKIAVISEKNCTIRPSGLGVSAVCNEKITAGDHD